MLQETGSCGSFSTLVWSTAVGGIHIATNVAVHDRRIA